MIRIYFQDRMALRSRTKLSRRTLLESPPAFDSSCLVVVVSMKYANMQALVYESRIGTCAAAQFFTCATPAAMWPVPSRAHPPCEPDADKQKTKTTWKLGSTPGRLKDWPSLKPACWRLFQGFTKGALIGPDRTMEEKRRWEETHPRLFVGHCMVCTFWCETKAQASSLM